MVLFSDITSPKASLAGAPRSTNYGGWLLVALPGSAGGCCGR
jgi:hypothetical protein